MSSPSLCSVAQPPPAIPGTHLLYGPWTHSPASLLTLSCPLPHPESLQDADRLPSVVLLRLIHLFGAVLAGGKVGWKEPVGQGVAVSGSLCWVNPLPISAHTCRRTGRRL